MHMAFSIRHRDRGFTLVEVAISAVLLALLSIATIASLLYSSQATRRNSNALAAKNVAQGFFERMAIDNFTSVTQENYPEIPKDSEEAPWLDEASGIRCGVKVEIKGPYHASAGGGSSQIHCPSAKWEEDEWAGDTVYLYEGKGKGQFAEIESNTTNDLYLSEALPIPPNGTTWFFINYGKNVKITLSWDFAGKPYQQTIESFIPFRKEDAAE